MGCSRRVCTTANKSTSWSTTSVPAAFTWGQATTFNSSNSTKIPVLMSSKSVLRQWGMLNPLTSPQLSPCAWCCSAKQASLLLGSHVLASCGANLTGLGCSRGKWQQVAHFPWRNVVVAMATVLLLLTHPSCCFETFWLYIALDGWIVCSLSHNEQFVPIRINADLLVKYSVVSKPGGGVGLRCCVYEWRFRRIHSFLHHHL